MEKQKYLLSNSVSRRKFLLGAGGLTFMVSVGAMLPKFSDDEILEGDDPGKNQQITAWVHVREDGRVTIYNPAAEMGQGSLTALAVLIAEEMDADWSKVHIENSPVEADVYGKGWGRSRKLGGSMITVGSHTVSGYFESLRHAGAQARYVLLQNVADKWKLPISELSTEPGVVVHKASDKRITFGEIASFAKAPKTIPEIPQDQLKRADQFRLIGTYIPRFEIPDKVNGSAVYSMDVKVPDMVFGVISRSPVHGSRPTLQNEAEIQATKGIIGIVQLDHGIGLIAETLELALAVKPKLNIEWSKGAKAATHTSNEAFAEYEKIVVQPDFKARNLVNEGNVEEALSKAAKTYSIDYKNEYVYHAQMEPLNAVVAVAKDGKSAEVWAGTQAASNARTAVAKTLGLDASAIQFHPCYLGGGFGRRSLSDFIIEATQLSDAVKRPVKLLWTREDDVQYGAFRPMSLQRMEAGIDKSGNITAWRHRIVGPGGRLLGSGARNDFYAIPNQQVEIRSVDHGIRTKHWRAVGHGPNKYAIEAFIDEIALDQQIDPYQFRKKLMRNNPRAMKVLDTVAEMANWSQKPAEGRARGIAFAERSGSLSAGVIEISLDRDSGKIKVHHIWAALDAGIVVQPDNAIAQMEGSILFGLGSVLKEEISFENGVVQQSNFHNYQLLRMADIPETLEVKIIPSQEKPEGIGEAGLPVVGGAVASAFAMLTGKRLRHMPFTPKRVKEALNA